MLSMPGEYSEFPAPQVRVFGGGLAGCAMRVKRGREARGAANCKNRGARRRGKGALAVAVAWEARPAARAFQQTSANKPRALRNQSKSRAALGAVPGISPSGFLLDSGASGGFVWPGALYCIIHYASYIVYSFSSV